MFSMSDAISPRRSARNLKEPIDGKSSQDTPGKKPDKSSDKAKVKLAKSPGPNKPCSRLNRTPSLPKPVIPPKPKALAKNKNQSSPKIKPKVELSVAKAEIPVDSDVKIETEANSVAKINIDNSVDYPDASIEEIKIPDKVRKEAGPHWRLREAILCSYYFGRATLNASDFARSNAEVKTAEIIADPAHSENSKKYHVKTFLANYRQWLQSANTCTHFIRGKRKNQTGSDDAVIQKLR